MEPSSLECDQLEDRLAALHRASLELVQNVSLESLLQRIGAIACEQVNAGAACVGVVDEKTGIIRFIPTCKQVNHTSTVTFGAREGFTHSTQTVHTDQIPPEISSRLFPNLEGGVVSFLGVPLLREDQILGQIYLVNKTSGEEFSKEDCRVIETLAWYAAAAIYHARLYTLLSERERNLTQCNRNQSLLNELASTLNIDSSANIDEILRRAMVKVMDYLHLEVAEVFLLQEDSNTLKLIFHRGDQVPALWTQSQYYIGEGTVGEVAKVGQPILISDLGRLAPDMDPAVMNLGLHEVVCFPLSGQKRVLGVLCIGTDHPRPLDELEMQFLSTISSWLGIAIENVRLNIQQRRLAVLEERERIGMDLHDGIIQSIYAVGLTLEHARLLMNEDTKQAAERINQAINGLNNTIRDIRSYILDLRPRQLHGEDLKQGVQRLVNEFRANTLVDVELNSPANSFRDLPQTHAITLFHICQEALANAAKHARSSRVAVTLWTTANRVLMEVSDNGRGFDVDQSKFTLGHGLSNIQTRARNVGGDVEITSEPTGGTTILAWVPIHHTEK